MTNKLSIIITVKDRDEHLVNCLQSINNNHLFISEVVVVHMNQPAKQHLKVLLPDVKLNQVVIYDPTQELPLAKARNFGTIMAVSNNLFFLDVDCVLDSQCCKHYLQHISNTNVLMGRCQYLPENKQHLKRNTRMKPTWDLFWSLSFVVTKDLFSYLNGFDEDFTNYGYEDTDFAYRAHKHGIGFKWIDQAVVYHQWHEQSKVKHQESLNRNKKLFESKHGFIV